MPFQRGRVIRRLSDGPVGAGPIGKGSMLSQSVSDQAGRWCLEDGERRGHALGVATHDQLSAIAAIRSRVSSMPARAPLAPFSIIPGILRTARTYLGMETIS